MSKTEAVSTQIGNLKDSLAALVKSELHECGNDIDSTLKRLQVLLEQGVLGQHQTNSVRDAMSKLIHVSNSIRVAEGVTQTAQKLLEGSKTATVVDHPSAPAKAA